jgi:hypothetical protein
MQLPKLDFNFDVLISLLALHFSLAVGRQHEGRATKIDLGGSASMAIIDGRGLPLYHIDGDFVDRVLASLLSLHLARCVQLVCCAAC